MELECARESCKVDIRVNSPLSYTGHDDSYIILLFSYSIRFILVRSCEILGRTNWVVSFLFSYFYWERTVPNWKQIWFDPSTKKNGCGFRNVYIRPHSGLHSWQWDWGIICNVSPNDTYICNIGLLHHLRTKTCYNMMQHFQMLQHDW